MLTKDGLIFYINTYLAQYSKYVQLTTKCVHSEEWMSCFYFHFFTDLFFGRFFSNAYCMFESFIELFKHDFNKFFTHTCVLCHQQKKVAKGTFSFFICLLVFYAKLGRASAVQNEIGKNGHQTALIGDRIFYQQVQQFSCSAHEFRSFHHHSN